ncbi:glycosyltransferase family 2 protein [Marinobacter algicola]|uniref:Probable glycosyltransferase n=1 Tax=Marinobacter algicola DG893 TaxID=443152 RepID=A6F1H8_9GAMM|nr:glycosyltransferase family 2 protein [Marinobacter algicola]EDM47379.1 probable glycosyltransferase [Marinobacter algicola DG893]
MKSLLPEVTIGIPFYNAELTLLDAVKSVFAQSHQNWELILLDDGSTDRSLELARSIRDSRVRVYSDGRNCRLAARLNQIAELASSDYIARMDADDLISPKRIERQLEVLIARPEIDLVSTGICSLTGNDEPIGVRGVPDSHVISARALLLGSSGIVHASLLGKRDWFLRNRYREDIRTGQDANLWVRAFAKNDLLVGFIEDPLYYYREDGNVVSKKLINAYGEVMRTIVRDSGSSFSLADKSYSYILTFLKIFVVRVLNVFGSLTILRDRRSGAFLGSKDKEKLIEEIQYIKNIDLPTFLD